MSLFKYAVPALAVASGAYAQRGGGSGDGCTTTGTYTLTDAAEVGRFATCTTFAGSIAIATDVAAVDIAGPERITGDLIVEPNGALTALTASNLAIVDGTMSLRNLGGLGQINMPELRQVDNFILGSIGQSLLSLNFVTGIQQVTNLTIDDTYLNNLQGINLVTAGTITVTNNHLLNDLTLQIKNTTGVITIRGNPNGLNVGLSRLQACGGILINDCSRINLASLAESGGLLSVKQNNIQALNLPNLTRTNGFEVSMNPSLTNISVPVLTDTTDFNIITNEKLTGNITFPSLQTVTGAIVVNGTFASLSFPALERVQGTTVVHSSEIIADTCDALLQKGTQVFQIRPTCGPTSAADTSTPEISSTVDGTNSGTTDNPNAAFHLATQNNAYSVFGILAALFGLLM